MFDIKTKMEGNILNNYSKFVEKVTSKESNELDATLVRLMELNKGKSNMSLLLTSSLGLSSESGEFNEIVKKIIFQGKPLSEDNIFHMKRELGDILWYWVNACRALSLDPNDVLQENVRKLQNRFPGEKFSIENSENRAKDDL
jgi:NTP pyrophosphatase (non-canonical NTP hydrolase)